MTASIRSEQPLTTAQTKLICLLGHPVAHSVSPQFHDAALREVFQSGATAIDARYLAFDVAPSDLFAALEGLVALGFLGANATIPHKQAIFSFADKRTEEAQAVGVANTLFWENGSLVADNTDATGLRDVLAKDCEVTKDTHVHIYGAGGAARAAAVAAGRLGAKVTVNARRLDQANIIQDLAYAQGAQCVTNWAQNKNSFRPDVTINATPLGRHGEIIPDEYLNNIHKTQIALDLNYEMSPYLQHAQAQGAKTFDGHKMLIAQAEQAFERWIHVVAPTGLMAKVWHNLERN